VGAILILQWGTVSRSFPRIGAAVLIFTIVSSAVGSCVAAGMANSHADRVAIAFEFPCRNLGLAVLVAVESLGRPEVAGIASAFLLSQLPILLLLSLALRRVGLLTTLATP
jgi:predicted Na+-dependent transporter